MIPTFNLRAVAARRPYVLDVSNVNPIDTTTLRALNPIALVCKATEGDWFVDKTYATHRELARQAGIPFGAYLFLHARSPGSEAEWFLEHAKPAAGDLQPMIDAEVRDGASFAAVAGRVDACAKALEGHGYAPLHYSYTSFLRSVLSARPTLARLRVWQASYTMIRPRVGHGSSVVAWQYTDALPAAGGHHYDASRLFVPLDSLRVPR